uniref:EF-hand domain-containing protein n=1 Tax=Arion vulgaris TaxID=1028688 RepID=A0A0B7AG26_9EUPU
MFLYAILFALSTLIMSAESETNEITFNLPEFFQQKDINKDGVLDKTEHKLSLKDILLMGDHSYHDVTMSTK